MARQSAIGNRQRTRLGRALTLSLSHREREIPAQLALTVLAAVLLACSNKASGGANVPAAGTKPAGAAVPIATLTIPGSDGQPVQGIQCLTTEELAYHIHAHLTLLVDGNNVLIPAGIGIAPPRTVEQGFITGGKCFYWLHTHDVNGIIHIESPTAQIYTLGQFFGVWGQPLSSSQVATSSVDSTKPLHTFVNGQPYTGAPEKVPLNQHDLITLEIGRELPPPSFNFPPGN